ncbi:SIS domain-containing protein [Methanobrevibacter millerae]|uniref:6-phospho-3-hexuloisomerase n=1 Tax=Methanobrevibacter millerae TaxID=230361 RepID=A0A1G5VRT2_9EURY|nr:SIS domain-containing protein [Methanobrevibacter millerae]SDA48448.1 6-phospho-3-hexuloisomerase [Methanobrevibacter millerae]
MSELKYMDLSFDEILKNINESKSVIKNQEESILHFMNIILEASNKRVTSKRETTIFLAGAGRSGFVAKSFAMRLMHLGFYVYVFNESILPSVRDGDIIIIISKSGKSNSITQIVEDSQMDDVKLLTVCGDAQSDLAQTADAKIIIESLKQESVSLDDGKSLELILMGSGFEISALVLLDALVTQLMAKLNLCEQDLKDYHDVLSSSI